MVSNEQFSSFGPKCCLYLCSWGTLSWGWGAGSERYLEQRGCSWSALAEIGLLATVQIPESSPTSARQHLCCLQLAFSLGSFFKERHHSVRNLREEVPNLITLQARFLLSSSRLLRRQIVLEDGKCSVGIAVPAEGLVACQLPLSTEDLAQNL